MELKQNPHLLYLPRTVNSETVNMAHVQTTIWPQSRVTWPPRNGHTNGQYSNHYPV